MPFLYGAIASRVSVCHALPMRVITPIVAALSLSLTLALAAPAVAQAPAAEPPPPGFGRGDRDVGAPFSGRSAVVAPNAAAATAHPLATQIAIDILRSGGTAMDAAIAANAMLGLVEPTGCGIGGDLYAIVWDPKSQRLWGYNGSGRSPRGQSLEAVRAIAAKQPDGLIPSFGTVTVSVPGAVDGWFALHTRFGRTPMRQILAPSIAYARSGAPIPEVIAHGWNRNRIRLEREFAEGRLEEIANARALYWPNGEPPRAGDLFRNPDLARTYELIARGGRRAFYEGDIARRVDAYMRRIGGAMRFEDFAAHRGEWVDVLCAPYRQGVELCELGGNTQGITAIQILQMLQRFDMRGMGFLSADSLHVQIEAKRLAFADRALAFHDPAFSRIDQRRLIDPAYAAARSALIRLDRAMEDPSPGAWLEASGDTTYLTVADKHGMMVSLIQSNYRGMGSGLVVDGAGFMLQNRGELFAVKDGHPNLYAPGKRPFQTIIPGFAMKDGAPWLSFGLMGGDMQPQGHAQIIINLVDYGLDLQAAGDAARWRHGGSAEPTGEPAQGRGVVVLETGVPEAARAVLRARGHDVRGPDGSLGGYQAIMRNPAGGYIAATEMRKDGVAGGY